MDEKSESETNSFMNGQIAPDQSLLQYWPDQGIDTHSFGGDLTALDPALVDKPLEAMQSQG